MKKYKYILLLNIFISALFSQYGKNIVQYENFDWHFIQTKNFDIYYYGWMAITFFFGKKIF